jgi:hypothetical protein
LRARAGVFDDPKVHAIVVVFAEYSGSTQRRRIEVLDDERARARRLTRF